VKRAVPEAAARLDALAAQWSLDAEATDMLSALLTLLRDDPRAATSVRTPAAAVDVHLADSLTALPWLDPAASIADVGSGAGFPGLPLAIARPAAEVHLIESSSRKCRFMESAVRALALANVHVVCARAEEWAAGEGRERHDFALVRAVAPLATLVEYAAPLLRVSGRLIAWKGERDAAEERGGAEAAARVGLAPAGVHRVHPFPGSREHNLHLYAKVRPTPARFPRRAGAARKRPLG
jgi:16S rRNA (guanine527-N7)-methyltransferase